MQTSTPPIPTNSLIFGYGPMVPLAAAALGAWLLPVPWPGIATELAILWGGLILAFVAGVRRGFGFGVPSASTLSEIAVMMAYFIPAGLALIAAWLGLPAVSLALLAVGYALVIVLDVIGARVGDAPAHFARLRPSQMAIAVVSLIALLAHLLIVR